jgi:hypothetical protein
LWAILEAFVEKEAWSTTVYGQTSNVVGGSGGSGAQIGGRKKAAEKRRLNLQSLAVDFHNIPGSDYLRRIIGAMHVQF